MRDDSAIKSPKDLAGKRIAGPGVGSVMHVALVDWVKNDGGDPSGIVGVEVPFPNMMDQLKAGRVDAVEQLEPFVGVMRAQRLPIARRSAAGDRRPDPVSVLDRRRRLGAQPPRRHQEIRDLARRRPAVIKTDDQKARAILAKYTGLPEAVMARIPFPHYDFSIKPEQLDVWQKLMVGQGHPVGKLDMKKLVVTQLS